MKKVKLWLPIIAILLFVTACGNSSNVSGTNKSSDKLTKVRVTEPVRGVLWGPVHVANELGYFKEEGLDVELITLKTDTPTAPVLAGEADFGLFGPEMILRLNEQGQGVKLLLSTTHKYPYSLLSSSDITEVSQLKGKSVNGADSGSSPRQFVRAAIANAGLDPDNDVTYTNLPNSGLIAAIEKGDIKATYASPEARQKLLDNGANLLEDIYDKEVHKAILGSDKYEMYITFTTDKFIKENPEVVQKYVNAIYKAILWTNNHSSKEIADVLKPSFKELENLESVVKEIKDNDIFSTDGSFSDDGYKAINKIAKEAKITHDFVPREKTIDDSFLKKAQENIK